MKMKEMAAILQVKKDDRQDLKEILDALEAEGKIHRTRRAIISRGRPTGWPESIRLMQGDLALSP